MSEAGDRVRNLAITIAKLAENQDRREYVAAMESALVNIIKVSWPRDTWGDVIAAHIRNIWRIIDMPVIDPSDKKETKQ